MAELTHEAYKRLCEKVAYRSDPSPEQINRWIETAREMMGRIKQLETQVAALKAENKRLKAPFAACDAEKLFFVLMQLHEDVYKPTREDVLAAMNAMLQERAALPVVQPSCDHSWRIDTGGECPKCAQPAPDGSSHD